MNRKLLAALATAVAVLPVAAELRIARPVRPPSERWQSLPIHPKGGTRLGVSFRSHATSALTLECALPPIHKSNHNL